MKDFYEVMNTRRSIRKFTDATVSEKDIREIVSLAAKAPSACNCQSYKFIAVRDRKKLVELAKLCENYIDEFYAGANEEFILSHKKQTTFFSKAPLVFFVLSGSFSYHDVRVEEFYIKKGFSSYEMLCDMGFPITLSVGAAVENLLLAAHAKGLGACFMIDPIPARERLQKALGVEERLMAVVPVGYPAYTPQEKTLKPIEDILMII